jgi:hypothetical protein
LSGERQRLAIAQTMVIEFGRAKQTLAAFSYRLLKEIPPMAIVTKPLAAASETDIASSPLARNAGPLAIAAGGLFAITQLVTVATLDRSNFTASLLDPIYLANGMVYFGAFCLLILALAAIYARAGHRSGKLWSIGTCAAIVGPFALGANVGWFDVFAAPWIALVAPEAMKTPNVGSLPIGGFSSYVLFLLGWVLFGAASFRARLSGCDLAGDRGERAGRMAIGVSALRRPVWADDRGAGCVDAAQASGHPRNCGAGGAR